MLLLVLMVVLLLVLLLVLLMVVAVLLVLPLLLLLVLLMVMLLLVLLPVLTVMVEAGSVTTTSGAFSWRSLGAILGLGPRVGRALLEDCWDILGGNSEARSEFQGAS